MSLKQSERNSYSACTGVSEKSFLFINCNNSNVEDKFFKTGCTWHGIYCTILVHDNNKICIKCATAKANLRRKIEDIINSEVDTKLLPTKNEISERICKVHLCTQKTNEEKRAAMQELTLWQF